MFNEPASSPLMPSSAGRQGRPFPDDRGGWRASSHGTGTGLPGRHAPSEFGPWQTIWKHPRRRGGEGTRDGILAEWLTIADSQGVVHWSVSVDSTVNRAHQHGTNLHRATGARICLMNPRTMPLAVSRGGLSTKIHALVDGEGRPLVLLVAPGQGGDAPMFTHLMDQLKIHRTRAGQGATRPGRVRGDEAYSSRAIRTHRWPLATTNSH
ncbi:transposase [Paenarthrobacter nicotinovorans]|uniref:transposase n=1 Tax=Paenarthrobacter nicotinovorans TaxID=29320 RepID=UPI003748A5CA